MMLAIQVGPKMVNAERTIQFSDLKKQTEYFWWATENLRKGHHSGAFYVLQILRKVAKSEQLKFQAGKILRDMGYAEEDYTVGW